MEESGRERKRGRERTGKDSLCLKTYPIYSSCSSAIIRSDGMISAVSTEVDVERTPDEENSHMLSISRGPGNRKD